MEHWWVHPTCHASRFVVTDLAIRVLFWIEAASNELVFSGKSGKGTNEPTISYGSLDDVVGFCTTVYEFGSILSGDLVEAEPGHVLWLRVALRNILEV